MASERSPKRVKTSAIDELLPPPKPEDAPLPATPVTNGAVETPKGKSQDGSRRSSWYSGTWPRKAAPVTQVARESISSASNAATEAIATVRRSVPRQKSARSPSLAMTLSKTKSHHRASPAEATTSTVHAQPEASPRKPSEGIPLKLPVKEIDLKERAIAGVSSTGQKPGLKAGGHMSDSDKTVTATSTQVNGNGKAAEQSQVSWFPWLSKAGNIAEGTTKAPESQLSLADAAAIPTRNLSKEASESAKEDTSNVRSTSDEQSNKSSWLQTWGVETSSKSATPSTTSGDNSKPASGTAAMPIQASKLKPDPSTTAPSQASSMETAPSQLPGDSTKSAAWVFWSRAQKNNSSTSSVDQPHVGEIAISDTPSARRPRRASFSAPSSGSDQTGTPNKEASNSVKTTNQSNDVLKPSQAAPDDTKPSEVSRQDKKDMEASKIDSSNATATTKAPTEAISLSAAVAKLPKKSSTAQLLPLFSHTFAPQRSPTLLEQIGRLLNYTKTTEPKHLNVVKDPPRIRNALAIGVHGYFPAPLIRTVLGQPTGTSIKFADMAAKSIQRYTKSRGYECSVKTAALEGEGKIAERIDLLWKLLLNWIDEIRKADLIMVACHSQGVPVAIMLVAKLIEFGCVSNARIGICAMAGVSLGPFLEYKSRWISGSAGELFEFSDPSSKVSTDYVEALQTILSFGCRLSFIGSIDDQLVSLESSIFASITHPHIYRAVLIDGRTHAPNFLSHLVGFALKLRNLGVQDHGLVRELSSPLAGSLYTGQGHSMIYEELCVYDLAVCFALETTDLRNVSLMQSKPPSTTTARNPYILPFALRGMLEEEFVKTELHDEAEQLLRQFDEWRPATKVLQDVKFRLEGIRSRLL